MLKVNNKKAISDIAKTTYKANKKEKYIDDNRNLSDNVFDMFRNFYRIKLLDYGFLTPAKNEWYRLRY